MMHHRHLFRSPEQAQRDAAALRAVTEGTDTHRGAVMIDGVDGWFGLLDGKAEFGGAGYTHAELFDEIDAAILDEATAECSECDGTGRAFGRRDSGYARWGDCPCCDGTGVA